MLLSSGVASPHRDKSTWKADTRELLSHASYSSQHPAWPQNTHTHTHTGGGRPSPTTLLQPPVPAPRAVFHVAQAHITP
ncbi:hypothetical protein E2C01_091387 [Portunus trituberculatus]|uniref:Uncharacterized protein n=1 Tax=Portunus trituberculatus TaxID=210409 RepID=A0A5B7JNF5_PORTR|nr:hypothetical protein [Portunus trituberculatus]